MRFKQKNAKTDPITEAANERRWVYIVAGVAALFCSIPYIWALMIAPEGAHFTGFTHNVDDGAVYISWMRQIMDGSMTYQNLFAGVQTGGKQFNLLILAMGLVAKAAMLPAVWVFHGFRLGLVFLLVWFCWTFAGRFIDSRAERKFFVILLCFSSGIGWLFGQVVSGKGPVDMWQPEAITFLSMYLNPLFLAGLVLMAASFHFLLLADKTGQIKHAIYAGLCLLALTNIHTYDIAVVGATWLVWYVFSCVVERSLRVRTLLLSLLAAAISFPALAYQFYLYSTDPLFSARVNTAIASPVFLSYICGFGIVFLGALFGIYVVSRRAPIRLKKADQYLPVIWMIIGLAMPYIPIAQQRKLIMGVHIPLCILAAMGISWLVGKLPRKLQFEALIILIVVVVQSNISFMKTDIGLLSELKTVTHYPAYLSIDQIEAANYITSNTTEEDIIFASPTMSLFVPAISARKVYYGHWSETPDYSAGLIKWKQFTDEKLPQEARRAIWLDTGADYYISESEDTMPPTRMLLYDAEQVFSSGDVRIYKLNPDKRSGEGAE